MKKVLVLFGGVSSEHDVSCVSASYVVSNIPRDKYEVCPLGITKEGEWFLFEGDVSLLPGYTERANLVFIARNVAYNV